ncbi:MAG: 16S rRNA (guanine(966)-N(2))-methyltransferase RsmD [Acidobacteria bacterium]|nr:MAG: 16S rRNA (guanine(966)-N(2))-methyltransferase RsmD [Acidobacteriota bacterium]
MKRLRIIGGEKRGFTLISPEGRDTRPTSSRVREALFDILGERVRGHRFLDLFAGTGSVGIEALSRGAVQASFVEASRANVRAIRENLLACGLESRGKTFAGRLPACLFRLAGKGTFDVAFVDPPYDSELRTRVLEMLAGGSVMSPGAWIVLEHRKSWSPHGPHRLLRYLRTAHYGDTELSFYQLAGKESPPRENV